jgi:hypothetical protein
MLVPSFYERPAPSNSVRGDGYGKRTTVSLERAERGYGKQRNCGDGDGTCDKSQCRCAGKACRDLRPEKDTEMIGVRSVEVVGTISTANDEAPNVAAVVPQEGKRGSPHAHSKDIARQDLMSIEGKDCAWAHIECEHGLTRVPSADREALTGVRHD